jgi:hypothetical protein
LERREISEATCRLKEKKNKISVSDESVCDEVCDSWWWWVVVVFVAGAGGLESNVSYWEMGERITNLWKRRQNFRSAVNVAFVSDEED